MPGVGKVDFHFCCKTNGKPYNLRVYRGSFSFGSTGALREATGPPKSLPRDPLAMSFGSTGAEREATGPPRAS